MMFLVSNTSGTFKSFGGSFYLDPITYPNVDLANILVVEDSLGKIIMNSCPHILKASFDASKLPNYPAPMPSPENVPDKSKVLILRGGGIGDLILFIPALNILRSRLAQGVKLYLATFQEKVELFEGISGIEDITVMPKRMSQVIGMDYYLEFSGHSNLFGSMHMTDFYLTLMKIPPETVPPESKTPFLPGTKTMSKKIIRRFERLRKKNDKIVYCQTRTSSIIRNLSKELCLWLAKNTPEVTFVTTPEKQGERIDWPRNLIALDTTESLCDYITAIFCSDAVISPDSSAYHIAAALNKPAITLFGPIGSTLRSLYSPTVIPLDAEYAGITCKSPCGTNIVSEFRHLDKVPGYDSSKGCPEANMKKTDYSPCILSIPNEKVWEKLKQILNL